MTMGVTKYEPGACKTQCWRALYKRWTFMRLKPHSDEFDDFKTFYEWAMSLGFTVEHKIMRWNPKIPFSRENCYLVHVNSTDLPRTRETNELIRKWNETVNRIRKHYGMPLLEELGEEENNG